MRLFVIALAALGVGNPGMTNMPQDLPTLVAPAVMGQAGDCVRHVPSAKPSPELIAFAEQHSAADLLQQRWDRKKTIAALKTATPRYRYVATGGSERCSAVILFDRPFGNDQRYLVQATRVVGNFSWTSATFEVAIVDDRPTIVAQSDVEIIVS